MISYTRLPLYVRQYYLIMESIPIGGMAYTQNDTIYSCITGRVSKRLQNTIGCFAAQVGSVVSDQIIVVSY